MTVGRNGNAAAPRVRKAAMAAEPVVAKIDPASVALDLDSLEREDCPPPFDSLIGGRVYTFKDPQDVDWQDLLASMSNPVMFIRKVLPPEDHVAFFTTPLPNWKMSRLMEKYMEHFGLPSLPNAAGLPR